MARKTVTSTNNMRSPLVNNGGVQETVAKHLEPDPVIRLSRNSYGLAVCGRVGVDPFHSN